jgi:hypothetical protein
VKKKVVVYFKISRAYCLFTVGFIKIAELNAWHFLTTLTPSSGKVFYTISSSVMSTYSLYPYSDIFLYWSLLRSSGDFMTNFYRYLRFLFAWRCMKSLLHVQKEEWGRDCALPCVHELFQFLSLLSGTATGLRVLPIWIARCRIKYPYLSRHSMALPEVH